MRTRTRGERPGSREVVLGTVHRNASALLRIARQHSICPDDAHDAYQRGIEIFLRRCDDVEPETALSWLRTVVNHTFDLDSEECLSGGFGGCMGVDLL